MQLTVVASQSFNPASGILTHLPACLCNLLACPHLLTGFSTAHVHCKAFRMLLLPVAPRLVSVMLPRLHLRCVDLCLSTLRLVADRMHGSYSMHASHTPHASRRRLIGRLEAVHICFDDFGTGTPTDSHGWGGMFDPAAWKSARRRALLAVEGAITSTGSVLSGMDGSNDGQGALPLRRLVLADDTMHLKSMRRQV